MIYFDNVTKEYKNGTKALDSVSFTIAKKDFVTIVGASGAGKTTLTRLILGEELPSSGSVSFESFNISKVKKSHLPNIRRKIGTVFQDYKLLPNKNAYENVAFAMEVSGRTDSEIEIEVPHVFELIGLRERMWNFPSELSGGEMQRVALGRAIVNQPELLIADEPTGNLDAENTKEIIKILQKINDLGTTVILTTHDKEVIKMVKDTRIMTFENGKLLK